VLFLLVDNALKSTDFNVKYRKLSCAVAWDHTPNSALWKCWLHICSRVTD